MRLKFPLKTETIDTQTHTPTHIYIRVTRKVNWFTKIISWNAIKGGSFYNIVIIAVHTAFSFVLQCFDTTEKKISTADMMLSYELFHIKTFQLILIYI